MTMNARRLAGIAVLMLLACLASAADFPLTIEHKFGTTVIPEKPIRIASVDFAGADDLLALGVQPVTIRHWYGNYPRSLWPWADALLEGEPNILKGNLNFEQIAAAKPDVIIALWSGIDNKQYKKLSKIAPVVAVPKGVGDYELPWDQRALITGQVIGKLAEAEQQVAAIRDQLLKVKATHPKWAGKTAAIAYVWGGKDKPGAYTSKDIRPQILSLMGLTTPAGVDALMSKTDEFTISLSPEDLSPIDGDLIIWITSDSWENILDLKARPFTQAAREGREVFAGVELTSAFSHASLLSLPFAIERLVPMVEAALDGDPTTHADDRPENL